MKSFPFVMIAVSSLALVFPCTKACGQPVGAKDWPDFKEVYELIRSNLSEVTETELNQAAVLGLLERLRSQVVLTTNAPAKSESSLISKRVAFDDTFGYVRISQVGAGLAKEIRSAFDELRSKRKLSGLIVDLRFAGGEDYAAATDAADLFFSTEQPLLKWNDSTTRSSAKSDAIRVPIALLVNRQTSGSAEALAAALRQAEIGLVIGSATAGQARMFKEFALSNGQRLKIGGGPVETADGQPISAMGLTPDIRIVVTPEDEKAYFDDPYKALPKLFTQSARPNATNELSGILGTNRLQRRRLNESELVRMQRGGADAERESSAMSSDHLLKPVVNDPALARGIDFLKGVALVQNRR